MMSDTMTLAAVAAKDRATIRALVVPLIEQLTDIRKRLRDTPAQPMMGFGAYDDDQVREAELRASRDRAGLIGSQAMVASFIQRIEHVYGPENVAHAIEEGECRIGSLPYVD